MSVLDEIGKHIAKKTLLGEFVDEATFEFRIGVCKTCEMFKNGSCKICGCYMDVKALGRTHRNPKKGFRLEVTHCQLGKWHDKELANQYREMDGLPLID